MPIKPQILAAISAAVQAYLLDEEAVMAQAAMAQAAALPAPPANLWGISGRQWVMQTRQFIQRRALK
jgi:hypothetical protein